MFQQLHGGWFPEALGLSIGARNSPVPCQPSGGERASLPSCDWDAPGRFPLLCFGVTRMILFKFSWPLDRTQLPWTNFSLLRGTLSEIPTGIHTKVSIPAWALLRRDMFYLMTLWKIFQIQGFFSCSDRLKGKSLWSWQWQEARLFAICLGFWLLSIFCIGLLDFLEKNQCLDVYLHWFIQVGPQLSLKI